MTCFDIYHPVFEVFCHTTTMRGELPLIYKKPKKHHNKILNFTLFEPSEPITCPISQDDIMSSELDFLPGIYYVSNNQRLRGIRLDCGHAFSGMHIVYQWARNHNVLCPVCRNGHKEAHIDLRKLPEHFRIPICRQVRSQRRKDAKEQLEQDHQIAVQLSLEVDQHLLYGWMISYASVTMISCAVVRQCNNNLLTGFRIPCNIQLTNRLECIFTFSLENDPVKIQYIRNMKTIALIGILGSPSCDTKFPQSRWINIVDTNQHHHCNATNGVFYSLYLDENKFEIAWKTGFDFFKMMAEYHENKIIMSTHGLI
jgi:hypothetical protein